MSEVNGFTVTAVTDVIPAPPAQVIEAELQAKVADLEAKLDVISRDRDNWFDRYLEAKRFIQASIDREDWTTDELSEPFWEELAGLLNLDLKLEREITVTVTWNLTVKGKADLSSYDFEASIEPANGQLEFISGESWPDIEVSE
jgi:hypothetical protein